MALETAASKRLQCVVVTPERAVVDEPADFVAIPMFDGELGVLPGRLPIIGRVGAGELRFTIQGKTNHYFVDGGFLQVKNNIVTVLTSRAVRAEEIKVAAAQEVLNSAVVATTDEAIEASLKAQDRARKMLSVATKASS